MSKELSSRPGSKEDALAEQAKCRHSGSMSHLTKGISIWPQTQFTCPALTSSWSLVYTDTQHVPDGLWVGEGDTKAKDTRDGREGIERTPPDRGLTLSLSVKFDVS